MSHQSKFNTMATKIRRENVSFSTVIIKINNKEGSVIEFDEHHLAKNKRDDLVEI